MILSHSMNMLEIASPSEITQFLEFPLTIYKEDKEWIRPLDQDIEQVFDRSKNKTFRYGEIQRWLLIDEDKNVLGRIAAFTNKKISSKEKQPTGGIGFFECINDQKAADYMFDHCIDWLKQRGMEAVDGPINFGERDRFWGLLVDGFYEPVYCMNYNPPYYKELFENYGFQTYFEQYCFSLNTSDEVDPKFKQAYERLTKEGNYTTEHIRKNNLEKYASDFTTIYNKAWAVHGGGKDITYEQSLSIFKKMKPVMEDYLVWFAYYKGEPVGAWLNLPELNQYFKHMNGKFGWLQKLLFLWLKITGQCEKFFGIVFGVVPEHQSKGVDGLMIWSGAKTIRKKNKYHFVELQWIGDFNPKMIAIAQSLGAKKCRTLITYRKLFDDSKEFIRHKIL